MCIASRRSDLEKAILAHGGMAAVAKAMDWPVKARQRRPNGYWDQIENVRQEIDAFVTENGLQPGANSVHLRVDHRAVMHEETVASPSLE